MTQSTNEQIFTDIYKQKLWGTDKGAQFYSGEGSHSSMVTSVYVQAITNFITLLSTSNKPTAVDLGCGDFFIGSNIHHLFSNYIACDVVSDLINHHKKKFHHLNVDFRQLDIAKDDLPQAEVGFVRQVLQHLSNEDVRAFTHKAERSFKYLVCTEHVPTNVDFVSNIDKPSNYNIRLELNSGIDLTKPPFNLHVKKQEILCAVPGVPATCGGIIITKAYHL